MALKNLKIVAENLNDWTSIPDKNYDDLNELFGELIGVYRRYIYHVHSMVGGVYKTLHTVKQNNVNTYKNVPKEKQEAALRFLNQYLWKTQNWLLNRDLITEISGEGELLKIQNLQRAALNRLLSTRDLNRMLSTLTTVAGEGLSPTGLLNILYNDIIVSPKNLDVSQMSLQLHLVDHLQKMLLDDKLQVVIKSDVRELIHTKINVKVLHVQA